MVGWIGVFFGIFVGPFQLWKILKSKKIDGISTPTYTALCLALLCYLIHAIQIKDAVFITAQSVNLLVNSVILYLLIKAKKK